MAITPYNSPGSMLGFNVYQPKFIGRPVGDISKMVDYRTQQDQRLVNQASATDLALANVDINPMDTAGQQYLAEQQAAFKQGINDIVENKNYKLAPALINKMSNDFIKNKGIQTAVENQQEYTKYVDDINKRYEAGKISDAARQLALSQGPANTELDVNTGTYNRFKGRDIYNYFDADKVFSDYADKFEPTITKELPRYTYGLNEKGELTKYPTGYSQRTVKYKDPDVLKEGLKTLAVTNPDMYNSLSQEAEFRGIDADTYIEQLADNYARRESGVMYTENGALYKPTTNTSSNSNKDILGFNNKFGGTQGGTNDSKPSALIEFLTTGSTKWQKRFDAIEKSGLDAGLVKGVREGINTTEDRFNTWLDVISNIGTRDIRETIDRLDYDNADKYYKYSTKSKLLPSDEKDIALTNNVLRYKLGADKDISEMSEKELKDWLPKAGKWLDENFQNELYSSIYMKPDLSTSKGRTAYKGTLWNMFGKEDGVVNIGKGEKVSGNANNSIWFNLSDNKVLTGKQFSEAVNNKDLGVEDGDILTFNVKGVLDHKNPLAELSGNDAFTGNVAVVDINGEEWYAANPINNPQDLIKHKFYNLQNNNMVHEDLTNYILPKNVIDKYGKDLAVQLLYNEDDNTYSISFDSPGGVKELYRDTEENVSNLLTNKEAVTEFSKLITINL